MPGNEAIIVYGPRRVGKTTLLYSLEKELKDTAATSFFSLDDPGAQDVFKNFTVAKLDMIFSGIGFDQRQKNYLFLDEILFFDRIDLLLKLIVDHFPYVKILASSSSSLLLVDSLSESLAGRKYFIELLPLTLGEIFDMPAHDFFLFREIPHLIPQLTARTEEIIIYGSYPEIINLPDYSLKRDKLKDIVDSALFKDIFLIEGIRNPKALTNLLTLLAHQIGALINTHEIATILGISRRLVDEYIGLLEKFFIIFRLLPFSRNPRSEIGSKYKIYFWDTGIRNQIINRFDPIGGREDKGALLENLIISGIARRNLYSGRPFRQFFWRNYAGAEIDLILEAVEKRQLLAMEIKFSGKGRISKTFDRYSPDISLIAGFQDSYRYCL